MRDIRCLLRWHKYGVVLLNGFVVTSFRGEPVSQSTETTMGIRCIRCGAV